jgi:photosynthetic reaction center cytochrome c subunit
MLSGCGGLLFLVTIAATSREVFFLGAGRAGWKSGGFMFMRLASMRTIGLVCALALVCTLSAAAQQPAPAAQPLAPGEKTAEQAYKNIQVLQGIPASQLIPTMRVFSAALGVRCGFCHMDGDQSSDMKPEKGTARKMVAMMIEINKANFNARQQVTCYTCHNGHNDPANMAANLPAAEMEEGPRPTLPSADDILSRYITAIGGEQAIRKVTSRMITATLVVPTGVVGDRATLPAQMERYEKAPNLAVTSIHTDKFSTANGFDGTTAWAQDAKGKLTDIANPYQGRAQRTSDFYEDLDLKQEYTRLVVRAIQKVNDRDAYVVIGTPTSDLQERLYFDTQTGLLLRKVTITSTIAGNLPAQVDYDDYRDTGSGVKIPFTIHMVPITTGESIGTETTIHVQKVQDNVAVDSSKFTKPASKTAQAQ